MPSFYYKLRKIYLSFRWGNSVDSYFTLWKLNRKVERVDSFIVSCERICIFPFLFGLRIIMKIDLPPFFLYHSCYKQLCLIIFHSLLLHPSPHYILLLIHFSDNQEEPVTIQSTHSCWNSMSYKKGVCYFILIVNLITTRSWQVLLTSQKTCRI